MPEKSERRGGEDEAAGFGVPVRLRLPVRRGRQTEPAPCGMAQKPRLHPGAGLPGDLRRAAHPKNSR